MNRETPYDLRERTTQFALEIIRFYVSLPKTTEAQVLGKQILRSGTSVGAQYREGSRARSAAEFISKMESSLQELEETSYWLELLQKANIVSGPKIQSLAQETNALTSIFVTSIKTAKLKAKPKK